MRNPDDSIKLPKELIELAETISSNLPDDDAKEFSRDLIKTNNGDTDASMVRSIIDAARMERMLDIKELPRTVRAMLKLTHDAVRSTVPPLVDAEWAANCQEASAWRHGASQEAARLLAWRNEARELIKAIKTTNHKEKLHA